MDSSGKASLGAILSKLKQAKDNEMAKKKENVFRRISTVTDADLLEKCLKEDKERELA